MSNPTENLQPATCSRDRRRAARYPVAGAVSFQWMAANGKWQAANGVTRDIGKSGAFIVCRLLPPVAAPLQLTVTLPTRSHTYGPVCLRGTGDVTHIQSGTFQADGYGAHVEFQLDLSMPFEQSQ